MRLIESLSVWLKSTQCFRSAESATPLTLTGSNHLSSASLIARSFTNTVISFVALNRPVAHGFVCEQSVTAGLALIFYKLV